MNDLNFMITQSQLSYNQYNPDIRHQTKMTEKILNTNSQPTKWTMKDFIDTTYDTKYNIGVNSKYSTNSIPKNQREFGQRKRIKP